MKHPVRLGPDGDVAVRDLIDAEHGSGHYTWRSTRGKWLTDADVDGWTDLQPAPSAVVDIRYSADKAFGDDALCDVDVNGHAGARRASVFVAGAFIVSAAVQKGEPIMVRASRKDSTLKPVSSAPALSLVRGDQDGG